MSPESIIKCWKKSSCLPKIYNKQEPVQQNDSDTQSSTSKVTDDNAINDNMLTEELGNVRVSISNIDDDHIKAQFVGAVMSDERDQMGTMEVVQALDMMDDHKGEAMNEIIDLVDNLVMNKVQSDTICDAVTNAVEKNNDNGTIVEDKNNVINLLYFS